MIYWWSHDKWEASGSKTLRYVEAESEECPQQGQACAPWAHEQHKSILVDGETMEKHKINLAPKYAHLLGDASGPKPKAAKSM